jgi:hypothetical protein
MCRFGIVKIRMMDSVEIDEPCAAAQLHFIAKIPDDAAL